MTNRKETTKRTTRRYKKNNRESRIPDHESIANIIERISDGFVAFDPQMNYTYVNERGGELLERKPEDLIGKNYWNEYPEAKGTPFADAYVRALETQKAIVLEDYYEPFDRWFENRIHPSSDGLSIFFTDITERKRSEQALSEQERFISAIANTSPAIIYVFDMAAQSNVYSNTGIERILGYSPEEVQAMGSDLFVRLIHPDDLPKLVDFQSNMMAAADTEILEIEYRMKDRDRQWRTLHSYERPFVRNTDGSLKQKIGIAIDITERKQAEELQAAIYQISEAANKAESLDELYQSVHTIIGRVMLAHNFYIALYDNENDLISFPYYVDEMDRFTSTSISAARPGRGMTEYVIRTGKPLLSDIANFEELARRGEVELVGPPSPIWIGAPLIIDGRTIGVIAMQDYADPNVYTERDLRILEYVSGQVAKAIERTQLYSDIRRRNQILSALQESTLVLMGGVKLTDVLQAIVTQILQLMDTPNGFLYLVEPDGENLKMRVGLGINSDSVGLMLKPGEGLAGKIWKTHQPLVVQDYHSLEGRSRRFEEFGIQAMVGVPLLSGSQTIGVLGVQYMDASRTISAQDVELLTRFAQLASIALENARFYQAAQDELNERIRADAALVEAEAKYRELVERLPVVVYTSELGTGGAWHYVSPQIESLLGFTPEEWMADRNLWYQQVHPEDREQQDALEERAYVRGEPFESEYRIFTRTGREIWIRDSAQILPPREGELPIVQGVLVDITERKNAEGASSLSRAQLLANLENTPNVAIQWYDESGKIQYWNPASESLYGWKSVETVGKTPGQLIHTPEEQAEFMRILHEIRETGRPFGPYEARIHKRDGSAGWVLATTFSMPMGEGQIGFVCMDVDITKRKQIEESLQQAEKRYRMLVEQLPMIIYTSPASHIGSTTYVSPQIKPFLGYTQEEWLEDPDIWIRTLHPDDSERVLLEMERLSQSGGPSDMEYRFVARDGRVVWIRDQATLVRDAQGYPLVWQGLMIDITERKRTEDKIKRHLDHLKALRMIDMTITASADLHLSLQTILRQAVSQLQVDAADILLLNPTTHLLEYSDGVGFLTRGVERSSVRIGEGLAGRAVLERKMASIHSLYESKESLTRKTLLDGENFTDYYGVPLIAKGEVKGVLEVFQRARIEADQEWEDFLESLAGQAGLAIDNATLFQNLQRSNLELGMAYESTLEGWSAALDLRDKETEGHTLRVTNLTLRLAKHMGLSDKDLMQIRRGALLHDIGKMGVPDRILLKPDNLTTEEWEIMQRHPVYAYELLSRIEYLRPALSIPYCHHEKWNGTGYPRGLRGEEIPLDARVFSVVDVYDALVSDRPYRPAWTKEKALEYIRSLSGVDFDPRVVAGFLELLNRN